MIFTVDTSILNEKLLDNNINYPFLFLKDFNGNYDSIILCVDTDSNILIYQLDNAKNNKSLINKISIAELAIILPLLVNCKIEDLRQSIISNTKDTNEWQKEAINEIINNLKLCEEEKDTPLMHFNKDSFNKSVNLILNRYINNKLYDINLLLLFVEKTFSISEYNQVKALFKAFENRLGTYFYCEFSYTYKYYILRELICVVTGKHVVLDPLTFNYIYSECTMLCKIGKYYSRLIRYKSSSGDCFIERRGPGWIDITSCIIFKNGLLLDSRYGPKHDAERPDQAAVTLEEKDYIEKLFTNISLNEEEKEDHQYLMINVDYKNLGHILWNEVSGYIEFILTCKDAGLTNKKVIPVLPKSIPSMFSKKGVRSFFFPYIKKALYTQNVENSNIDIIKNYIDSMNNNDDDLINKIFIKNQPISFRFPKVSQLAADIIRNEFTNTKNSKIHIYVNIRFHNKSQSNIIECLSKLFKKLKEQQNFKLKPDNIELDLEFNSKAVYGPSFQARDLVNDTLSEIKTICDEYMVKLNLHDSYELPELMQLVSASDICIVAIGSGAILPTWIFNKYTVMHGNQSHFPQLEWWNQVGNIKNNNEFIIPLNAISQSSNQYYGNYSIDSNIYSDIILNALEAYTHDDLNKSFNNSVIFQSNNR